jgi:hypothetical protein
MVQVSHTQTSTGRHLLRLEGGGQQGPQTSAQAANASSSTPTTVHTGLGLGLDCAVSPVSPRGGVDRGGEAHCDRGHDKHGAHDGQPDHEKAEQQRPEAPSDKHLQQQSAAPPPPPLSQQRHGRESQQQQSKSRSNTKSTAACQKQSVSAECQAKRSGGGVEGCERAALLRREVAKDPRWDGTDPDAWKQQKNVHDKKSAPCATHIQVLA